MVHFNKKYTGLNMHTTHNTVYAVRFAHANRAFGTTSHTPIPLAIIITWMHGYPLLFLQK